MHALWPIHTALGSRHDCLRDWSDNYALTAECPPDTAGRALRGFTYAAIGQLATRLPGLARQRVDVAAACFAALSTEPAGVRVAVQECIGSLAAAYKGLEGASILSRHTVDRDTSNRRQESS